MTKGHPSAAVQNAPRRKPSSLASLAATVFEEVTGRIFGAQKHTRAQKKAQQPPAESFWLSAPAVGFTARATAYFDPRRSR